MPTAHRPLSPCLPAMRLSSSSSKPVARPSARTLRLSPRDLLEITQIGTRYSVAVRLAPAARPTGQTDDVDERLIHAARFSSYAAALRLQARVARAGALDVAHWVWTPREHGRFVASPTATPYDVEK